MKAYLASALRRAGKVPPNDADPFSIEPLLDGRTGAEVVKLRSGDTSYVAKTIPATTWRGVGTGCPEGGEPRLWLSGIADRLPSCIRWPVLDVSLEERSYRVLMEDVGPKFRARGRFTIADTRKLLRALSRMHAANYESEWLSRAPLPNVVGTVRLVTEPLLHLAGARRAQEPWVEEMLGDFAIPKVFLPGFLDLVGPRLADEYLSLLADDAWQRRLRRSPATLLHGDLRRANIALEDDGVALIDWELAAIGPPACDVQWHLFLHYWVYPPEGLAPGGDHELYDFYLRAFEEAVGRSVDRAAFEEEWALGWIKVIAQLGYLFYDSLPPSGGTPDARAAVRALATRALQSALEARARFG